MSINTYLKPPPSYTYLLTLSCVDECMKHVRSKPARNDLIKESCQGWHEDPQNDVHQQKVNNFQMHFGNCSQTRSPTSIVTTKIPSQKKKHDFTSRQPNKKTDFFSEKSFHVCFVLEENVNAIWVFPKIGVPQNGWFIMEHLIKMAGLGGTTILGNTHIEINSVNKAASKMMPLNPYAAAMPASSTWWCWWNVKLTVY